MSLAADRAAFEAAYARRSAATWHIEPDSPLAVIRDWCPRALVIAASPEHGGRIEGLLDSVSHRHNILAPRQENQPADCLAGYFEGRRVTLFHIGITPGAHGASYVDMALEFMRPGRVQEIVLIGECTALQEEIRIGELVVAASAIPADDSYRSYTKSGDSAAADPSLRRQLVKAAQRSGQPYKEGVCWSCGAAAGAFDPFLVEEALRLSQEGVLANTLEAATGGLLARLMGKRLASIWLVADSLFEPLKWQKPCPRMGWEAGWEALVRIGLTTLTHPIKREHSV